MQLQTSAMVLVGMHSPTNPCVCPHKPVCLPPQTRVSAPTQPSLHFSERCGETKQQFVTAPNGEPWMGRGKLLRPHGWLGGLSHLEQSDPAVSGPGHNGIACFRLCALDFPNSELCEQRRQTVCDSGARASLALHTQFSLCVNASMLP